MAHGRARGGAGATLALDGPLVLLGAGKMGGALLEGWLGLGLDPARIAAFDPSPPEEMRALLSERGIALNPDPASLGPAAVLLLAVKPQKAAEALPAMAPLVGPGTLVVSIMAGLSLASIGRLLGRADAAIVRAMPNTPASVGRGASGLAASPSVTDAQRATADALMRAVGLVEWLDDEALIDAVTAVSGSGPAYVFHLVEALAQAGVGVGLPAETAMRLARATVAGAGELLHASDLPAETLRRNVTSPGGTTAAALEVLMGPEGFPPLLERAAAAAKRRAQELAEPPADPTH